METSTASPKVGAPIAVKIKNLFTNEVTEFTSVDTAVRTLVGINPEGNFFGKPLHSVPSRCTFKEAVYRMNNNGYSIEPHNADQQVTDMLEKSLESQMKAPVKARPVKNGVELSQGGDVFALMADAIAKHLPQQQAPQVDLSQAINDLRVEMVGQIGDAVKTALESLTRDVIVTSPTGTKVNVGKQHYQFEPLLTIIAARINALLVGPAGSGKTMAAHAAATALGLPFASISVGMQTTKTDFLGYMDATGKYVRTLFRDTFEHGGVYLIDEMDAGNANVITTINQALANNFAAFPDGMVVKHPDFVIVASANTYGTGANREYVGRNQLDAATLDRFAVVNWNYDEALENDLCPNKDWLAEVRKYRANADKNKIRAIVSPRASIMGAKLLAQGLSLEMVREALVFKGLNPTERAKLGE